MKIRFKNKSEVDFSKIFPEISEEDYDLLEDQVISLDQDSIRKMEKNKFLNIGGYDISAELIEVKNEKGVSQIQEEIQRKVNDKFIKSEEVVDVLIAAVETGRNALLWGLGGHGKSEITELVMDELLAMGVISSKPYVMAFGDGLSDDKLYGGMNILKYREEGKVEYIPENSFMNHEIVIFEEIFDAPAPVLLGLKDIMTSGQFRNGNQVFKSKTKVIIGLTNKSKKEFAEEDDSLKALAERFALTHRVEWSSYTRNDFISLFKKVYGDTFFKKHQNKLTTLSSIIEMNNAEGTTFVSPRTAVAAADLFTRGKSLKYVSDLDPSIITKYEQQIIEDEKNSKQEAFLDKMKSYIDKHDLEFIDESESFLRDLANVESEMNGTEVDLSELDFGSQNDKNVKMNKCKFLLNIIDRQDPSKALMNDFTTLKKRVNGILKSLNDAMAQAEAANKASEGETESLPF